MMFASGVPAMTASAGVSVTKTLPAVEALRAVSAAK
jgi:hypothetical protein